MEPILIKQLYFESDGKVVSLEQTDKRAGEEGGRERVCALCMAAVDPWGIIITITMVAAAIGYGSMAVNGGQVGSNMAHNWH